MAKEIYPKIFTALLLRVGVSPTIETDNKSSSPSSSRYVCMYVCMYV